MTSLTLIKRLAGPFAVAAVFAISLVFAFSHAQPVHANPSFFDRSAGTAAATTSVNYMTPGFSTTTETFDTGHGRTGSEAINSVVLQLYIRSSTTVTTLFGSTTLAVRIEQSDNGIDWSLATSSTLQTFTAEQMGNNLIASTSATVRTIPVTLPLRYVRALVGVNIGSSNNGAVWMQFVGQRENN